MRYLIPALALSLIAVQPATAQQVAPGWFATGEWQCGPNVRIIASTDGRDGIDFYIIGAWFDNHYTLRRGQLYYNGLPCAEVGRPLAALASPPPRRKTKISDEECIERRMKGDESCGE